jgi:hypothetical protein
MDHLSLTARVLRRWQSQTRRLPIAAIKASTEIPVSSVLPAPLLLLFVDACVVEGAPVVVVTATKLVIVAAPVVGVEDVVLAPLVEFLTGGNVSTPTALQISRKSEKHHSLDEFAESSWRSWKKYPCNCHQSPSPSHPVWDLDCCRHILRRYWCR